MPFLQLLFYLLLCVIIGVAGKKLPIGFAGFFLISLFLTPPVGLLILILLQVFHKEQVVITQPAPVPSKGAEESEKA